MRLILTVFICLIAGPFSSFANGDSLGCKYFSPYHQRPAIRLQGGCIAPAAASENIRLDAMRVTIRGKYNSYSVDAVYHLFNTGNTATVTVGVPKIGRLEDNPDCDSVDNPTICDFLGFDAWVDGRRTAFAELSHFFASPRARPIGGYCYPYNVHCTPPAKTSETRWMTKKVTFPGKALTTIRVRYEALYHKVDRHLRADEGFYHWSTARYWKGKIGKAIIIFDMTDMARAFSPVSFPRGAIWANEMRDFEPAPGYHVHIPGCRWY